MKSPQHMKIIQIEITNACVRSCSNCTRFCGHHKKPFFMDIATFKKAVDSMEGYSGMVGVMGGEPTLHPSFKEIVDYYSLKIPLKKSSKKLLYPTKSFINHRNQYLSDTENSRGLWTSLGKSYYQHFEIIQDIFPYQCINDHSNPGLHQALLITRKELGLKDSDWVKLRDECWVQNMWSASITPKGAFFCEIAAALDMLFNGSGGWPIEKGWWLRSPSDFGQQLNWCELCSAALPVPRIRANSEVDLVSPLLKSKLEHIESPKIRKGKYQVVPVENFDFERYQRNTDNPEWYLPNGDNYSRINSTNNSLLPKNFSIYSINILSTIESYKLLSVHEFENLLFEDWCIITKVKLSNIFLQELKTTVLNTGCLYFYLASTYSKTPIYFDIISKHFEIILFNKRASSIKAGLAISPESLFASWEKEKLIPLFCYPYLVMPQSYYSKLRSTMISYKKKFLLKLRSKFIL